MTGRSANHARKTNKQTNKQRETQYFLEGCQSSWTPKRPIGGLTDKGDHQGLSLARDPTSRRHTAHIPWFIRRYSSIRQFIRPFIRSNLRVISSDRQSAISDRQSVCACQLSFSAPKQKYGTTPIGFLRAGLYFQQSLDSNGHRHTPATVARLLLGTAAGIIARRQRRRHPRRRQRRRRQRRRQRPQTLRDPSCTSLGSDGTSKKLG